MRKETKKRKKETETKKKKKEEEVGKEMSNIYVSIC